MVRVIQARKAKGHQQGGRAARAEVWQPEVRGRGLQLGLRTPVWAWASLGLLGLVMSRPVWRLVEALRVPH